MMQFRKIYITKLDLERLEELLAAASEFNYRDRGDLENLHSEIEEGTLVDSKSVPSTVVTMNSRVLLIDVDEKKTMDFTLVFPRDADIDAGRLSVLSPVGTAILGHSEGDVIEWCVPAGLRKFRIEKVLYQPEAAGDFHL